MRTLEEQAISSQNFFFLRVVAKRNVEEIVMDELEGFLNSLNNEYAKLKPGVIKQITNEIEEGSYFDGKSTDEIRKMLNLAIIQITQNRLPNVTAFYLSLIENGSTSQ